MNVVKIDNKHILSIFFEIETLKVPNQITVLRFEYNTEPEEAFARLSVGAFGGAPRRSEGAE